MTTPTPPDGGYVFILEWMEKAERNCRAMGKTDSAALWADGKAAIEAQGREIEALQRERDEARAEKQKAGEKGYEAGLFDGKHGTPCEEIRWQQERDSLREQLAAARADAERYRWLRDRTIFNDGKPFISLYSGSFSAWNGDAADSAIDKARGEKSVEPIPCNLPFERIPQHAADPGFGPVPPKPSENCPHGINRKFPCAVCDTPIPVDDRSEGEK